MANDRSPVGYIPTGHHQLAVFRLSGSRRGSRLATSISRSICFITLVLNQLCSNLSRKISKKHHSTLVILSPRKAERIWPKQATIPTDQSTLTGQIVTLFWNTFGGSMVSSDYSVLRSGAGLKLQLQWGIIRLSLCRSGNSGKCQTEQ